MRYQGIIFFENGIVYTFLVSPIMDKNLLMDEKMLKECWMTCLGKQCGRDWFRSWCCIIRVWCFVGIYKMYTF